MIGSDSRRNLREMCKSVNSATAQLLAELDGDRPSLRQVARLHDVLGTRLSLRDQFATDVIIAARQNNDGSYMPAPAELAGMLSADREIWRALGFAIRDRRRFWRRKAYRNAGAAMNEYSRTLAASTSATGDQLTAMCAGNP